MDARQRILDRIAAMSPTIRAAAKFVVDHPNEVVIGSMRALAARAAVQPATLVRLAQQLGYAGWPALKADVARDLGLSSEHYGERARTLSRRARSTDLASELFAAYRSNLDETLTHSADGLKAAAKMLRKADAVHIAGFRASFPIAYALYYGYRLFRDDVHLFDGLGGDVEMLQRAVGRNDVVVAASFAPYSREAVVVAEGAKAAGARVIALSDSAASPLALTADVSLRFAAASPSFFPSVAAGVALAEALLEQLVAESDAAVVRRIDASERQLTDCGAYVQGATSRRSRRA
jgi:DNA-binding MurR/RpiR family transcriptional regulator